MKMRVMMLGVTGLILSGCFFANDEIKLDDIGNFKITSMKLRVIGGFI